MCPVARAQTDRRTDMSVKTEDTISGFQEFFLQPIIKYRSNIAENDFTFRQYFDHIVRLLVWAVEGYTMYRKTLYIDSVTLIFVLKHVDTTRERSESKCCGCLWCDTSDNSS